MTTLRKAMPFTLLCAALLVTCLPLAAQNNPDCSFTYRFTGDGTQSAVSNLSGNTPCVNWRVTLSTDAAIGGTLSSTVTFQTSPDNATWTAVPNTVCSATVQPPCVLQGTNPITGTQGMLYAAAYGAYVQVVISSSSGTGNGIVRGYGSKGASASALPSSGGGGGSGTVTQVNTTGPITGGPITGSGTIALDTTKVAQKFFGTAAPGSVATNLPGDLFTDTTAHNEYVCNAPSGTAAPACTSVTAAGWLLLNGGGGGGSAGVLLSGSVDPGVPPAIVLIQSRLSDNVASLSYTNPVSVGDLLVLIIQYFVPGNRAQTQSDTLGNVWTRTSISNSTNSSVEIWSAIANSSGSDTITVSGANHTDMTILEFSGSTQTVDATSSSVGAPASVVATIPYDLYVIGTMDPSAGTLTTSGSTVIIGNVSGAGYSAGAAYEQRIAVGAYTPTVNSLGGQSAYNIVAFASNTVTNPGNNGDWYLNLTTGVLWGPKAGGLWGVSGWQYVVGGSTGSASTVTCWKADGKTLGYATVAEITVGTCH